MYIREKKRFLKEQVFSLSKLQETRTIKRTFKAWEVSEELWLVLVAMALVFSGIVGLKETFKKDLTRFRTLS